MRGLPPVRVLRHVAVLHQVDHPDRAVVLGRDGREPSRSSRDRSCRSAPRVVHAADPNRAANLWQRAATELLALRVDAAGPGRLECIYAAGWSSLVARRAHNPKVVGSNPTPATIEYAGQGRCTRTGPPCVRSRSAGSSARSWIPFVTALRLLVRRYARRVDRESGTRVFRVTVRGRFNDLTDEGRRQLVSTQEEHDILESAYTARERSPTTRGSTSSTSATRSAALRS